MNDSVSRPGRIDGPFDDPFENRLAAGMKRLVGDAPCEPRPVASVVARSRQRRARRRAGGAVIGACALIAASGSIVLARGRPGTGDAATGQSTAGTEDATDAEAAPDLELASSLQPFESCDDLLAWVKAEANKRVGPYGLDGDPRYGYGGPGSALDNSAGGTRTAPTAPPVPEASVPASLPGGGRTGGGQGSGGSGAATDQKTELGRVALTPTEQPDPAVSGTNVQERGVDEPDIVKSDGKRIFTLVDRQLTAFTVDRGTPRLAGSLRLPDTPANGTVSYAGRTATTQMLLAGDRLLLVDQLSGYFYGPAGPNGSTRVPEGDYFAGRVTARAVLTQVDVSDVTRPKLLDTVHIDGTYVSARMNGSVARVVVQSPAPGLAFVYPSIPGDRASDEAATTANQRIIDGSTISDWVPGYRKGSAYTTEVQQKDATPLLDCPRVRHPRDFAGFGMLSVVTVDVTDGIDPANAVGVLATGDRVYASQESLYVSTQRHVDPTGVRLGSDQAPGTGPGTTAGTTAGSTGGASAGTGPPATIDSGVGAQAPRLPGERFTSIHKFDIAGSGPAVYRASGEVDGVLLNDFAMSEHEGYLRTATTVPPTAAAAAASLTFVSVLGEESGRLTRVGMSADMGRGEQIKSVRFVGPVGYVVTFRQTDPLYTVDLADPHNPRVAGELKMVGYSAYLHPVGPGHLLGIGQDATEQGRTFGAMVALYDVGDPTHPQLLQKATVPFSSSLVEQEYHAFLWWPATDLAVVPVQAFGGSNPFVGAIGYKITSAGIDEIARVVNPINGLWCPPGAGCVVPGGVTCDTSGACPPPSAPLGEPILRSLVLGDTLVTLSRGGLQASALATLQPAVWVPFRP